MCWQGAVRTQSTERRPDVVDLVLGSTYGGTGSSAMGNRKESLILPPLVIVARNNHASKVSGKGSQDKWVVIAG